MATPTTNPPPTTPRPTSPWQDPPGTPRGPRHIPNQRTGDGDVFALPKPARSASRAFGVSSWTAITLGDLPDPAADARCTWCGATAPLPLYLTTRLPYCTTWCATRAHHACGDCGEDTRTVPTTGPLPACHRAGTNWVGDPATEQKPVHLPTHMTVVPLARAGRGFDWAKRRAEVA